MSIKGLLCSTFIGRRASIMMAPLVVLYPLKGTSVTLRLRVAADAPVEHIFVRTSPDGEQHVAPMHKVATDSTNNVRSGAYECYGQPVVSRTWASYQLQQAMKPEMRSSLVEACKALSSQIIVAPCIPGFSRPRPIQQLLARSFSPSKHLHSKRK